MAENHFHLNGSTKVFELNWMCLMNLIEGRRHDFKKIRGALQEASIDRIQEGDKKKICTRNARERHCSEYIYLHGLEWMNI